MKEDVKVETVEKTPQEKLAEFKKTLEGKTHEELEAIEQEIIKECDDANKEVSVAMIDLPGHQKDYEPVRDAILYFFNKQSVTWQYTLGMVTLVEFWTKAKPAQVPYPILDGTLRQLGELQFTGLSEWKRVILINNYFEPCRAEYVRLTNLPYVSAMKHDAVMNALGITTPVDAAPVEK